MIQKIMTGIIIIVITISLLTLIATEINNGLDNNSLSNYASFLRLIPDFLVYSIIALCAALIFSGLKYAGLF